jgi:hypothetical protein
MFKFDSNIPRELFSIQQWVVSILSLPIDANGQFPFLAPSGRPLSEEAEEFLKSTKDLPANKRIQIYHQQYWYRLLSALQQNFPLLTRLFGYTDFNLSLAIPFLMRYSPNHWSISQIGDRLARWIDEFYTAPDKSLVHFSAEIDWAYQTIFVAPPPTSLQYSLELLSKKMNLQKHVRLFKLPFDLFVFRQEFLKASVEFWTEKDFPSMPKGRPFFFVLYRNQQNKVVYQEISEGHWTLLYLLENDCSIVEACDQLEKMFYEETCTSLQSWVQEAVSEKWLMVKN